MTRKPAGRSATLRQAIAQEAARLMVERGIHDFLLATEHADVQLHVFADRAESLTLLLLDRHLPYELVERRMRLQADRPAVAVPGLRFDLDAAVIEVLVFALDGIRQSPVSPVDGKPMRRANVEEVRAMLTSHQALL